MSKKYWLIGGGLIVIFICGLFTGWKLHKPLPTEGDISDWWTAPLVPSVETAFKDRWKTKEKVVVLQGATVTITKDRVTVQKGSTVYAKECPQKPRVTFNSFMVEAGAGVVDIGTAPVIGYEAAFEYRPVTINVKSDISASIYLRAQADMSGADKQVNGQVTAGLQLNF